MAARFDIGFSGDFLRLLSRLLGLPYCIDVCFFSSPGHCDWSEIVDPFDAVFFCFSFFSSTKGNVTPLLFSATLEFLPLGASVISYLSLTVSPAVLDVIDFRTEFSALLGNSPFDRTPMRALCLDSSKMMSHVFSRWSDFPFRPCDYWKLAVHELLSVPPPVSPQSGTPLSVVPAVAIPRLLFLAPL